MSQGLNVTVLVLVFLDKVEHRFLLLDDLTAECPVEWRMIGITPDRYVKSSVHLAANTGHRMDRVPDTIFEDKEKNPVRIGTGHDP